MSLTPAQILYLHHLARQYGGGAPGLRDLGLLESAVARALQTFGGTPLYATAFERAAACAHAVARNHPFVDGNKRTAFLVLGLWLASEGHVLSPPPEDAVAMFEQVAQGAVDVPELARWARQWCE